MGGGYVLAMLGCKKYPPLSMGDTKGFSLSQGGGGGQKVSDDQSYSQAQTKRMDINLLMPAPHGQ